MMNNKIRNYVEALFSGIPKSIKATELKEELMGNLNDRYEDYLKEGKSESESYALAVASMGDIDHLLEEVMPDEKFKQEARYYLKRKAINVSIAIIFYFIALIVFLILATNAVTDMQGVLALVVAAVICIFPTILLVYTSISTPVEHKSESNDEVSFSDKKTTIMYKELSSIYWLFVLIIYFIISFYFGNWHLTWIIWIIASLVAGIIKLVFHLRDIKNTNGND